MDQLVSYFLGLLALAARGTTGIIQATIIISSRLFLESNNGLIHQKYFVGVVVSCDANNWKSRH